MTTKATVGRFSMDANGTVDGPSDYMVSPTGFAAIRARIEAGSSAVFNFAATDKGSIPLATLVAVQTHYAEWSGMLRFDSAREAIVRASQKRFLDLCAKRNAQ